MLAETSFAQGGHTEGEWLGVGSSVRSIEQKQANIIAMGL